MITDIWFTSGLPLPDLAARLGLTGVEEDAENYWAWVIGALPELGVDLDITRTHTVAAAATDTRIFVWGEPREMTEALVAMVVERLRAAAVTPIHAGRWIYLRGNEFDRVAARTFA